MMRRLLRVTIAILIATFTSHAAVANEPAAKPFRAGAATSNVTPPLGVSLNGGFHDRPATHVHDELHARCLVLDDGINRIAFAVVDSCALPREVVDGAKKIIAERTGIPQTHVLISATHTHEAPAATSVFQSEADADYVRFVIPRIADGVQRAANNLAPAQIGWAVGQEPTQVFNRRWRMKPGTVLSDPFGGTSDRVKMNPAVGSPELLEPAGPIDPDVWVLSVRSPDGKHIALLANYSLHYVGDAGPGAVSADYFGIFADRVQELLGADRQDPPFVGIMSNGTSGDVNNINFRGDPARAGRKTYEQMRHVADVVAGSAVDAVKKIEYRDHVTLSAKTAILSLHVRKPSPQEIERAEGILSRAQPGVQLRTEGVYARETLALAKYPDQVELVVQAIKVGELGIAAVPCEVFAEIGLELKKKSPIQPMFSISLANGYNGYLPPPQQHALGGYETWRARSSYLEVGAAPVITTKVIELLAELNRP